jgi:hypothetical protein
MGFYIEIEEDIKKEEKDGEYKIPIRRVLKLVYPIFKQELEQMFSFKEEKISLWKFSTLKETGGELIQENAEPDLLENENNGILKIRGQMKIYGKDVPIIIEVSADREYASVFGHINIDTSIDSEYETLCDLLDELPENEYDSFLDNISQLLNNVNSKFKEIISKWNINITYLIKYAYISRIPVDDDITELYYLYKGTKRNEIFAILDMVAKTVTENNEVEPEQPLEIKSRISPLTKRRAVVNFISGINEINPLIKNLGREIVTFGPKNSVVIKLNRSQEKRQKFYQDVRDKIILEFFKVLPKTEELKEEYIRNIKNLSSIDDFK